MNYAHTIHLIEQAANVIEGSANALRACSTYDGDWQDEHEARDQFEHEMALVQELRNAKQEMSVYHATARGLEHLLRAHREERRDITYKELAALLPGVGEKHT